MVLGFLMLEGWEWIIIGVVAIVIILWGPTKIPQLAKALGRAKGEFKNASKETNETAAPQAPAASPTRLKSKDELLVETAQNLGVSTAGKTKEQLSEEISEKTDLLAAQ
jgi:sec-independent protein translocase protein TatA